jgi:hypothetical protein
MMHGVCGEIRTHSAAPGGDHDVVSASRTTGYSATLAPTASEDCATLGCPGLRWAAVESRSDQFLRLSPNEQTKKTLRGTKPPGGIAHAEVRL